MASTETGTRVYSGIAVMVVARLKVGLGAGGARKLGLKGGICDFVEGSMFGGSGKLKVSTFSVDGAAHLAVRLGGGAWTFAVYGQLLRAAGGGVGDG